MPDTMVVNDTADPAAIVAARAGLRLALIASMQYLPPRRLVSVFAACRRKSRGGAAADGVTAPGV